MNDEVIENINMLSSKHLWQRQIAAIKLGEIGDLRAVNPLITAFEREQFDEVKQAIEKALEEIAIKNGFDNAEKLRLVAKREDRELEELEEINEENYTRYIAFKQINSSIDCIGEKCIFYDKEVEKEELPCFLKYYIKYPNKKKQLMRSVALETSSEELFGILLKQLESCQTGFMFIKDALDFTLELEKQLDTKRKQKVILEWFLLSLGIEDTTWEKELKKWDAYRIKETISRIKKIPLRKEIEKTILDSLNNYYNAVKGKKDLGFKREKLYSESKELEKQLNQKSLLGGLGFKKKQKEEIKKQLLEKQREIKKIDTQINEIKKEVKKATRPFREAKKILAKLSQNN